VVIGYNSKRGPSKDHLCQVWSKLANGFRGGLKEGDLRTLNKVFELKGVFSMI
jgi:hypothetical protein